MGVGSKTLISVPATHQYQLLNNHSPSITNCIRHLVSGGLLKKTCEVASISCGSTLYRRKIILFEEESDNISQEHFTAGNLKTKELQVASFEGT